MPTSKIQGCHNMRVSINEGVLCLTELGYCFFHNGTHLLKIPKKKFIEALDSHEDSLALTERYPAFFNMSEAKEARSAYERSVLELAKHWQ
jgi:hypothetical protein